MDRTLDDIGLVSNALRDAQAIIQQRNGSRKLLKKNREAKQNLFRYVFRELQFERTIAVY